MLSAKVVLKGKVANKNMPKMYDILLYILIGFAPSSIGLLGYMIRIERILAKTKTDICWIKKALEKCRQP